jgi:hypothetical protein
MTITGPHWRKFVTCASICSIILVQVINLNEYWYCKLETEKKL